MNRRLQKIASVLQHNLASTIQQEYPELANSLFSISHIDVSADLSWADVYCTSLLSIEEQQQQVTLLQQHATHVRHVVSTQIHLKKMPALRFHVDRVRERIRRIDKLLSR